MVARATEKMDAVLLNTRLVTLLKLADREVMLTVVVKTPVGMIRLDGLFGLRFPMVLLKSAALVNDRTRTVGSTVPRGGLVIVRVGVVKIVAPLVNCMNPVPVGTVSTLAPLMSTPAVS